MALGQSDVTALCEAFLASRLSRASFKLQLTHIIQQINDLDLLMRIAEKLMELDDSS